MFRNWSMPDRALIWPLFLHENGSWVRVEIARICLDRWWNKWFWNWSRPGRALISPLFLHGNGTSTRAEIPRHGPNRCNNTRHDQFSITARPDSGQPDLAPVRPCVSFLIWVSWSGLGQGIVKFLHGFNYVKQRNKYTWS